MRYGFYLIVRDVTTYCGKGKGMKFSLRLIKYHGIKTYGGVDVWLHSFLTSALDGGEWSASLPGRFTLRKRAHDTYLYEAEWDAEAKRISPCLMPGIGPWP
jgi:hypothetical protein